MSRGVGLAQLASVLLLTVAFAACERSATAPAATTFVPRVDRGGLTRGARLEAPAHKGGEISRTVGRWGGHLRFDDASAPGIDYQLDIPAGALEGPTAITMHVEGDSNYDVTLTATASGIDVGPRGFRQPIRLTISYATAHHPAAAPHLFLACVHDDGSFEVVKTQVNAGQKTLTGYLPHFSKWTVVIL